MYSSYIFLGLVLSGWDLVTSYAVEELRCAVCKSIVAEIENLVGKAGPHAMANVGSHRLDEKGNLMSKTIPLVRSETFLSEAMESACDLMEEYARGYDKKTRKLRVIRIRSGDGMNPQMSEIDAISDADLNESLKYHCEDITDRHEEDFFKVFAASGEDNVRRLCVRETRLCAHEGRDEFEL